MRKLLCSAVFALYASQAWGADPRWIRMPSADFEIFSSGGEGHTRRALQNFERVRNFFEQVVGGKIKQSDPVRIIVFGSKKEYLPYRPVEFAAAFYTQVSSRDYIVMGDTVDEVFPVAVHEYVHLVAQHAGFNLPPWLNEGLAEVYSTMKPQGDKILVGSVIPGRLQALQREKWVPVEVILAVDHDSPYYNEKSKAGSLYNEGWALTHMLQLSKEYRPGFEKVAQSIQKGTLSKQALETVYGKPLSAIEKDLQSYITHSEFYAGLFPIKFQKAESAASQPAPMFDVRLALSDLMWRHGKEEEYRRQLIALAAQDPKRPEPEIGLGYLAWREQKEQEAEAFFEKAMALGSKNQQMLWDYGRMAMAANPEGSIKALSAVLEAQPARFEVRLKLAQTQMNAHKPKDALETLKPIRSVTPKQAAEFFRVEAFANMQADNRDAAKANAQKWLEYAKEPDEHETASRLVEYLDRTQQVSSQLTSNSAALFAADSAPGDTDGPPLLTRKDPITGIFKPIQTVRRPFVSGNLLELDCKEAEPKLIVQSDAGKVALLLDRPRDIVLSGLGNEIIDMNCGPQKTAAVWIEYDPPAEATGVIGRIRTIHFEPLPANRP